MALLSFPSSPTNGQLYPVTPLPGQNQYQWEAATSTWRLQGAGTGVTTGTYGDASNVGQFTVDAQGRITFAQNVPISSTNYWSRSGTVLSPATVGDQIQASSGTTAAPGIAFTADATSGIGFDLARNSGFLAADSFRPFEFGAEGIKVLYYNTFGNTPPLQVYGAVNGAPMQAAARFQTQVSGLYDGLEIGFWPTDGFGNATTYYSAVAGSVSNNRTLSFFVSNQISAGGSKPDLVIDLDGSINILSQHVLQFWDANNSNNVGFRSPSVVVTNVTWTLPAADGTSGQVLSTSGTGTLSWASTVTVVAAPASSGAAGAAGQVASDSNYFYWYAGGGWQRVAKDTAPW